MTLDPRSVRRSSRTLSVACLATLPAWAVAGTGARFGAPAVASAREPLTTGGGALQVLLSLALVLGAILLLGWAARRLRVLPRGRSGAMRVVDEVALGAKERAVILEVDGARLVLGVGEGRVALLHRGEAPATPAPSAADATGAAPAAPGFAELMSKALGRRA
jgi:flagellar protein FliO/FliZ